MTGNPCQRLVQEWRTGGDIEYLEYDATELRDSDPNCVALVVVCGSRDPAFLTAPVKNRNSFIEQRVILITAIMSMEWLRR
jgi:hypothetical protein